MITTTSGGVDDVDNSDALDELVTVDAPLVSPTPVPTPAPTPVLTPVPSPAAVENVPVAAENTPAVAENAPAVTPESSVAAATATAPASAAPALTPTPVPTGENAAPADETPSQDISLEEYHLGNRGTTFILALKEFQKSPWTGMGPMGYTIKYGMYPHNLFLEMLCELGLAGSIPMMLITCFAIWNILRTAWWDKAARYMVAFLSAYVIQACISGCFWTFSMFLFALGYGLALPIKKSGEQMPSCRMPKE